jgi:CRISPR-associated protein Csd1
MSIILPKDYRHPFPAIWRILKEIATLGKSENIPSILSGALMRAVLSGGPYPRSLYTAILSRIRADQSKKDKTGKPINHINPIRAGIIKACLMRQARIYGQKEKEKMLTMSLNEESSNQGYILGRLFALLERAQEQASGGNLNSTIRDRYFGSASATPASVFPILLRLSQHHISKAEYGYAIDRQIQEVLNLIDGTAGFPKHLNLDDQGFFMLGYYQQRQAFYSKKEA